MEEETQSIRDLLRDGVMHLRYTDAGEERTLTEEQRKQESFEASQREAMALPVPRAWDSEDEASLENVSTLPLLEDEATATPGKRKKAHPRRPGA